MDELEVYQLDSYKKLKADLDELKAKQALETEILQRQNAQNLLSYRRAVKRGDTTEAARLREFCLIGPRNIAELTLMCCRTRLKLTKALYEATRQKAELDLHTQSIIDLKLANSQFKQELEKLEANRLLPELPFADENNNSLPKAPKPTY